MPTSQLISLRYGLKYNTAFNFDLQREIHNIDLKYGAKLRVLFHENSRILAPETEIACMPQNSEYRGRKREKLFTLQVFFGETIIEYLKCPMSTVTRQTIAARRKKNRESRIRNSARVHFPELKRNFRDKLHRLLGTARY